MTSKLSRQRKIQIDVAGTYRRRRSRRHEIPHISRIILQLVVSSLLCISPLVGGQLIGTDICGCQPATYTFTFDFSLTCDDNNVEGTPGVNETACLTEVRGKDEVPDEDLIPVSVQTVQIFELDEQKQVFSQTVRTGTFLDGSNFTYTSVISTISDLNDLESLPRGLQLVITGLNNKEEATVNTYIITYTNDCGIFPILIEGQTSGWTIFSDLGDPPRTVCPLVPSMAPMTLAPITLAPSEMPSSKPSVAPIIPDSPTRSPSIPTTSPVLPETVAPTNAPVTMPIGTDTPINVSEPTCAPIRGGGGEGKGGGKGDSSPTGKGHGKGMGDGSGETGKGKGKGKGNGKGGEGKGKGSDVGKGKGKGDGDSSSMGKGKVGKGDGDSIQKKKIYDGKMDRLSTENEDRLLATGGGGGIECPEVPDDDYYLGGGKGGTMGGKGKGGKGISESNGGKGKGSEGKGDKGDSEGKGGKGDNEGKGEEGDDAVKTGKGDSKGKGGKGENIPTKKTKDSNRAMEMIRDTKGKGKLMGKDDDDDEEFDEGKEGKR